MSYQDDRFREYFPDELGLQISDVAITTHTVVIGIQSIQTRACCPGCDQPSERVHSHYRRQVADLPWQGRHVVLRITLRRFRCANPACQQQVFCERLPALLRSGSRSTTRLIQAHRWIGHALGGEAGSRLTKRLSLPTSPDTLLRRVRETPGKVASTPRVLGVDDFAFRKGHTYGTVLVDLERRCLIDLLPDREAATLATWLQEHQGIEIVSRDRGTAYAQAVRASLPQATQVADRWHLLKNLQEALQKLFQRSCRSIRLAITKEPQPQEASMKTAEKQPIDQERHRVFQQVRAWRARGMSLRQIMKRTGLHYVTVRRYLDAESCPDWQSGRRGQSQLDAAEQFIRNELRQGNCNAASVQRKLQARGIRGSSSLVRQYVRCLKTEMTIPPARPSKPLVRRLKPLPSARALSITVIKHPDKRSKVEQQHLESLRSDVSPTRDAIRLSESFAAMVRDKKPESLSVWLHEAERSSIRELRALAVSLRRDEQAVLAALSLHWSNGPVEGHVNRLKFIKRSMFGRANFDLLKARVLKSA